MYSFAGAGCRDNGPWQGVGTLPEVKMITTLLPLLMLSEVAKVVHDVILIRAIQVSYFAKNGLKEFSECVHLLEYPVTQTTGQEAVDLSIVITGLMCMH